LKWIVIFKRVGWLKRKLHLKIFFQLEVRITISLFLSPIRAGAVAQGCRHISHMETSAFVKSIKKILENWNRVGWRRSMTALSSRIHWHCHFIQKFESECRIENETINRGYQNFPYLVEDEEHADFISWLNGTTGFPLIDASMRALRYSGYINFRSRAMVVSFACHYFRIHWKLVAKALARLFLDFEPGIHYPQIQMQAGVTGINTIRIYNPKKQAMDHDPEATFIKKWVPELNLHQPEYIINLPLQSNDLFSNDWNYPQAQYNFQERIRESKDLLWQWKKSVHVKQNNAKILAKHVRPQ
jgi:deoxyribodipyrimidine photo-lyase